MMIVSQLYSVLAIIALFYTVVEGITRAEKISNVDWKRTPYYSGAACLLSSDYTRLKSCYYFRILALRSKD